MLPAKVLPLPRRIRAHNLEMSIAYRGPGTLDDPIIVKSAGDEQYAGCTGYPADSHVTIWLTVCCPADLIGSDRSRF
jgi:hypothetical protein